MEIEVGDYIRTEQWGIAKVHIVDDGKVTWIKTKNNRMTHYFTQLKEPSKNIIDLIEVGDYVNGELVVEIFEFYETLDDGTKKYRGRKLLTQYSRDYIYQNDIKSIVTKEQFESMEYKMENNND